MFLEEAWQAFVQGRRLRRVDNQNVCFPARRGSYSEILLLISVDMSVSVENVRETDTVSEL